MRGEGQRGRAEITELGRLAAVDHQKVSHWSPDEPDCYLPFEQLVAEIKRLAIEEGLLGGPTATSSNTTTSTTTGQSTTTEQPASSQDVEQERVVRELTDLPAIKAHLLRCYERKRLAFLTFLAKCLCRTVDGGLRPRDFLFLKYWTPAPFLNMPSDRHCLNELQAELRDLYQGNDMWVWKNLDADLSQKVIYSELEAAVANLLKFRRKSLAATTKMLKQAGGTIAGYFDPPTLQRAAAFAGILGNQSAPQSEKGTEIAMKMQLLEEQI
eukprot:GSA25T00020202001.1